MTKSTPAVTLGALLHPAYEPGDGSADGAQLVGCQWWHPVMGCDSLQIVVDNARAILARFARPAVEPDVVSNPWRDVIDDALVNRFLLTEETESDPRKALDEIIAWEIDVSRDPRVSVDALTNAFTTVQERFDQLAGDQELMIYRWPNGEWSIEHTNPSQHVQLGEVSGKYTSNGLTLEQAVCNLAALLPENNTSQTEAP